MDVGFTLSAEEHPPRELVRLARIAEDGGFGFAAVSDHFHPWTSRQGQSSFVWAVIGGIASTTDRLRVWTTVTCPLIRLHPVIVAQAAATAAAMMPGRFRLGLGTGENLNEHVTGERWPSASERRDMLAEAVVVIRELWAGGSVDHEGPHYRVVDATLFTLPDEPPPIYLAAGGPKAARMAAELADGLITTAPDDELLRAFDEAGGRDKPRLGQLTVCWGQDDRRARRTAHEWWPNGAIRGELGQELPLPRHFEQAAEMVTEDDVAKAVVCGPDPQRHLEAVTRFADAGFDHLVVHQVGPDPEGGLRFYASEVLPKVQRTSARKAG